MDDKKLYCKYCMERKANGYCPKNKGFVPKKTYTSGVNLAVSCPDFKKK